jgi:hypothetical protein
VSKKKTTKASRGKGAPPHEPTEQSRKQAETMAGLGMSHDKIALVMRLSPMTLRKHYAEELARGRALASMTVTNSLMTNIKKGNVPSIIFYLKTRERWSEANGAPSDGGDGTADKRERRPLVVQVVDARKPKKADNDEDGGTDAAA